MTLEQILTCIQTVAVVLGILFAVLQLRGAKRELTAIKAIHVENHDWNRRIAAQDALAKFGYGEVAKPLSEAFDFMNTRNAISLSIIQEKFSKDAGLQPLLHQLLNFYEGLARGVQQGVFDEEAVKAGRKMSIIRMDFAFSNYIQHRRITDNPRAWNNLILLARKWQEQDESLEKRQTTGSKL